MKVCSSSFLAAICATVAFHVWSDVAQAAPTCEGGKISLGAVSTITGPADLSEVPLAAKAVFDEVNGAGGIGGCKIDYAVADDKADPAVAAQVARDLIDNKGVVALVGSASLLDCAVNGQTYRRRNILSIQGLGADAACFSSSNIAPVNVGQYAMTTIMGKFATDTLGSKAVCALFVVIGGTQEAFKQSIGEFEALSKQKMRMVDFTLPPQGDLTPFLIKARDAGCDAVITNESEPGVIQWMKTVEDQKISGTTWLFLAPAYTEQIAKVLAHATQPVYAGAEWEPFTDTSSAANAAWSAAMKRANRPLTGLSQGGAMSAQILVDVLRGIDGPVTRESVTKALETMKPISNPLGGNPYQFGAAATHAPMRAAKVVKLDSGSWKTVTANWLALPAAH